MTYFKLSSSFLGSFQVEVDEDTAEDKKDDQDDKTEVTIWLFCIYTESSILLNVNVWLCSFCKFTHWLMTESLTHCYDRKRRKLKLLLSGIGIGSWQMRPNQSGWVLWFPIPWFALVLKIYYLNKDCGNTLFMQLRNPKEVTKEEYNEFYKKTFNEYLEPLASSHFTTEVRI